MPIDHAQYQALAEEVRRAYSSSEERVLSHIARQVAKGKELDDTHWANVKLAEVQELRRTVEAEIAELHRYTEAEVAKVVETAARSGADAAVADIPVAFRTAPESIVPPLSVQVLARKTIDVLASTHLRILRSAEDAYRSVIAEATQLVRTGTLSRRQASQVALDRFAGTGITGFVDKAGRRWDLSSYAEMAVRTANTQAAQQAYIESSEAMGVTLFIVSDSPEECPSCRAWEGKVLSSKPDGKHPTVSEATAAGLFHPGCTHTLRPFIEGFTKRPSAEQRDQMQNPDGYKERQTQRYLERRIREAKRRQAVAITPEAQQEAKRVLDSRRKQMREFVDRTDRRRRYDRESITRAR